MLFFLINFFTHLCCRENIFQNYSKTLSFQQSKLTKDLAFFINFYSILTSPLIRILFFFKYLCSKSSKMKIGQKLKGMRIEKGLSTIEVAEKLDISESTYRRFENDKSFPDVFTLDKIAKIYDKTLNDILPEGLTVINHNNGEYSNNAGYIVNQYLSEKVVEQYEARLKEKDEQIALLKSLLERK